MTFSIIARDSDRGLFGVAVSTAVPCVGAVCPYAKTGVGAIASQSWVNVRLGTDGLRLLELGLSPEEALTALLQEDPEAAKRQVAGIDSRGRVYAYSGDECVAWYGHRSGDSYSVQGNMLVGEETIDAMADAFERSKAHFATRLLEALEAGQAAGGDKRGRESAALLVPAPEVFDLWAGIDIRVDSHAEPVGELRRIFDERNDGLRKMLAEAKRKEQARSG